MIFNKNNIDLKDIDVYIDGKITLVNITSSIDTQFVYKFNKRGVYNILNLILKKS